MIKLGLVILALLLCNSCNTKQNNNINEIKTNNLKIVDKNGKTRIELIADSIGPRIVLFNEYNIPKITLYSSEISTIIEMNNNSHTVNIMLYVPYRGSPHMSISGEHGDYNLITP